MLKMKQKDKIDILYDVRLVNVCLKESASQQGLINYQNFGRMRPNDVIP